MIVIQNGPKSVASFAFDSDPITVGGDHYGIGSYVLSLSLLLIQGSINPVVYTCYTQT